MAGSVIEVYWVAQNRGCSVDIWLSCHKDACCLKPQESHMWVLLASTGSQCTSGAFYTIKSCLFSSIINKVETSDIFSKLHSVYGKLNFRFLFGLDSRIFVHGDQSILVIFILLLHFNIWLHKRKCIYRVYSLFFPFVPR
jgi:hypothetical protein